MRILYFCNQTESIMSMWQVRHFFDELSFHNISIDVFGFSNGKNHFDIQKELLDKCDSNKYHLFMTSYNEKILDIETLKSIKAKGVPTLLICFDNSLIPYFHKKICKYFDLTWLMENANLSLFKKWGANYIYMPYAANPYSFQYNDYEDNDSIVFVGTPYGSRANTINQLAEAGIKVCLYGNKINNAKHYYKNGFLNTIFANLMFQNGRKILAGAFLQKFKKQSNVNYGSQYITHFGFAEKLSDIYPKYGLCLSSTTARNTGVLKHPIDVIDLRSFEIPMCGGIQFCRYNPELATFFEEDKEIIFYRSKEEMIQKAKYYLSEESRELRKKIRKAARMRAEKDHTWWARFKKIFDSLGIEY